MYSKIKYRIYQIIEKAEEGDRPSRTFDVFIITLILLNGIVIILNFIPTLSLKYYLAFNIFETISVSVFTIEYFLRLWTCNINKKYRGSLKGRIKYMFTPLALIDLLAIIPLYIPMIFLFDPKISKVIRLLRIFKLLKFCRYFEFLQILGRVIRKKPYVTFGQFVSDNVYQHQECNNKNSCLKTSSRAIIKKHEGDIPGSKS